MFRNLPFDVYRLAIVKDGFAPEHHIVTVRSNIPVSIEATLRLAGVAESVSVFAQDYRTLVQPEFTGTRTDLNAAAIDRLPAPVGGRGIESVLLSFPGFAADANGAIHPRGAHNQMQYVIDGMPITDQLTGAFGTAIDSSLVQSIELFTGNIPAEFGSKISGVANITTRTGLGSGRRFAGSAQFGAAEFDTLAQTTHITGGTERIGYFASLYSMKSNRFLDQVSLDNLHNGGNAQRAFTRLDYQSGNDTFRLSLLAGRSSFQLANLRSQHGAGQRQSQYLDDFAASLGWVRALSPRSTVDATLAYRTSRASLYPSAGDTPVTASQARHLGNLTTAFRFSRIAGPHTLRAGGEYQHFPLSENFSFGITNLEFNHPDSPEYNPALLPFDLSRGGALFHFSGKAAGNQASGFAQDQVRLGRLSLTLGVRYDEYRFLVLGRQLQPRVGAAFHIRETDTVLRASYNRTYQTPVNENLLFSNSEEAAALTPPSVREAVGSGLIRIPPQRQNVYEVGVQQALFGRASLNAVYYHKDERDLHDNDNFLNTGIIFPTSLARSRVNGAELRLVAPPVGGFSGSVSLTHYHVVVTPPFTGGLFLGGSAIDALSGGPFLIDHDQPLSAHLNVSWNVRRNFWMSAAARYDSGLVTNPSDPAAVAADPDYADLLPYVNLESDPPRVQPRTIVDLSVGYDHYRADRRVWDLQFQVTNIFDKVALYNFQSIFVGTRLVQPRTAALRLRWHW